MKVIQINSNRKSKYAKAFRTAFPKTIPVMAGYLVMGFGFGLLLQSKGYNFLWAILMGVTIYGGSMQYVGVDILASGVDLITAAVMSLMIQARHLFYGISMITKYRNIGKAKPYLIFGMTDETYSLVSMGDVPEGVDKQAYYLILTALNQSYWVIGDALGAIFGQVVHINTAGVDFAMTSLFIVIVTENLLKKETRLPALIGIGISLICLMIFGADKFLIPTMIAISVVLMLMRPILSKSKEEEKK